MRPEEWGRRQAGQHQAGQDKEPPAADWDHDVVQAAPYFAGQTVHHGIFGTGTVSRVEGTGDDMMVTVDFESMGRKHINPRFAPLVPVD